jgi:predicted DNA-binding transcriptional regulator AlpA
MARSTSIHNYAPRGLRHPEAANYVGMKLTKFDNMVSDGRMPKPRRVDTVVVWDKHELDAAFDELPRDNETPLNTEDKHLQTRLEAFEHG